MLMDAGYYYKEFPGYQSMDTAPSGQIMFVISAGHYKLLTLDFFSTIHKTRADYQLIYIKEGILYFDENGEEKQAHAGSFILFKPGEYQKYIYYLKDKSDMFWVHFSGSAAYMLLKSNNLLDKRVIPVQSRKRFEQLFHLMIASLNNHDEYTNPLNTLYIQELIISIAKEREVVSVEKKPAPEYLKAIEYISEHLSDRMTLENIADFANVTTKTLTRHFKKNQNMSPMRYVNFMRIEKAKDLLQSNNSIGQIASALGFDDPLYFSTVFRRYAGLSPEKYRKSLT